MVDSVGKNVSVEILTRDASPKALRTLDSMEYNGALQTEVTGDYTLCVSQFGDERTRTALAMALRDLGFKILDEQPAD